MAKRSKKKVPSKERLKYGEVEIPSCIHSQTFRMYCIGGGMFLVGIFLALFSFDLYLTIGIAVLSLAAVLIGFFRERKLSYDGFQILEGTCYKIEYTLGSQAASMVTNGRTKDTPSRFLILTEDGLLALPYYKHNQTLDEGDKVRIFFPNNVKFIEVRGALTADSMLGYELIL